jgi:3-oxo-5alpha-steroid 4-dehydrogenase
MKSENSYDVVIVGYGAAGAAAAIEAADAGARVLVLDRGYGGGASALSGGVVYAGGGTPYQQAAGLADSPENMYNYLRQEVKGVVSDATLRRFCETSPAMIAWLERQGARYRGTLCPYKTSYPTDAHYLYYSGNEKAWPYKLGAEPAARGHRQVAEGMSSGHVFFDALRRSAAAKGVEFRPLSRVHELIIENGAVAGVRYRTMAPDGHAHRQHQRLSKVAGKLGNWVPPAGAKFGAKAEELWQANATEAEARAASVILSGGGFVFNPEMKARYDGGFRDISPLGTAGDDGSVINLGVSAGGTTDHLERMTAWRFMSPPSALLEGVSVGPTGARIANEDLYGATHSQVLIDEHGGHLDQGPAPDPQPNADFPAGHGRVPVHDRAQEGRHPGWARDQDWRSGRCAGADGCRLQRRDPQWSRRPAPQGSRHVLTHRAGPILRNRHLDQELTGVPGPGLDPRRPAR